MTKRNTLSTQKNIWSDGQQVDDVDLKVEQQFNDTVQSSIISNHIGMGVLTDTLTSTILFDSTLETGTIDGKAIFPQSQPSDSNYGNQLELTLSNSKVSIHKTVKVIVIGLDFQNNLQYETFTFKENESIVGKKHFTKILVLLFNDLLGSPSLSQNLGGKLIISEASSMTLSRDAIMAAQDVQPNLVFRDFFVEGGLTLNALLSNALPFYNIDSLNIYTGGTESKMLLVNDVTSQIGGKFLATSSNIQKITLLMSVRNMVVGSETDLAWEGELVVSVYPLQSSVECYTDISPTLPIDFSPSNIPVAQLSVSYSSLLSDGIELDSVAQPVDFVFSNSSLAGQNSLNVGSYYAFTVKRSGAANKCDILFESGLPHQANSRYTTFTGAIWLDIPETQLWFQLWTDAAKVSDGQGYESGHGISIPKVIDDPSLGTINLSSGPYQFYGNNDFTAVVQAVTLDSDPVPDQRTGNPVFTRQQYVPNIQLMNQLGIANLQSASEPLMIGSIADKNKKFFDSAQSTIVANLYSSTIVKDELIIRMVDDPTDPLYDTNVISLQTSLLNGDLINAKFTPNADDPNLYYRVGNANLCSYVFGDVNGDGIIDENDLDLLQSYIGVDLTEGKPFNTTYTTDGITSNVVNGYETELVPFTTQYGVSFQMLDASGVVVATGTDGILVAHPTNERLAQFTNSTINFNTIVGLSSFKLAINEPSVVSNFGAFNIVSLDPVSDVLTIRKIILSGDAIGSMLRADIDGDFHVTYNDGYLLENYINCNPVTGVAPFPAPTTNAYDKIGKRFNVIRVSLEKFQDRLDDYTNLGVGRGPNIHKLPDVYMDDASFELRDFTSNPSVMEFEKKLTWNEQLIVVNSDKKIVPSVFTENTSSETFDCKVIGTECTKYAEKPIFDPGRVDVFCPNNVIIGDGQILRPSGDFYKIDFEVGTIVLELPEGMYGSERTINLMDSFIANDVDGRTKIGNPAMKFADCSFVSSSALANDQVRFSVSVQAFSPNINGVSEDGYVGAIVDGKMGVNIDYATGLLTLNFSNLYSDEILKTLQTKIQIHVYLKKAGFNNKTIEVPSEKVKNMMKLISVFSGPNLGGASALIDLGVDVQGVLPVINGGTGLNTVGALGQVLMSTGSGLTYQFVQDTVNSVDVSTGSADSGKLVKLNADGHVDSSMFFKSPDYVVGVAGKIITTSTMEDIGSINIDLSKYDIPSISSIKLEVVVSTASSSSDVMVYLNDSSMNNLILSGTDDFLSSNINSIVKLTSDDILPQLSIGDNFLMVRLSSATGVVPVVCMLARLIIEYINV